MQYKDTLGVLRQPVRKYTSGGSSSDNDVVVLSRRQRPQEWGHTHAAREASEALLGGQEAAGARWRNALP